MDATGSLSNDSPPPELIPVLEFINEQRKDELCKTLSISAGAAKSEFSFNSQGILVRTSKFDGSVQKLRSFVSPQTRYVTVGLSDIPRSSWRNRAVSNDEFEILLAHHSEWPDRTRPNLSHICLLYTSPSPRDQRGSRMPSSA